MNWGSLDDEYHRAKVQHKKNNKLGSLLCSRDVIAALHIKNLKDDGLCTLESLCKLKELAKLKLTGSSRQASGTSLLVGSATSDTIGVVQAEVLIRQIFTFIQQRGGGSDFASTVQHFKVRIPSKDLPVFKSLLREIATLQKNPNGSSWIQKPDYL